MYIKAGSIAFPAYLPPHHHIQFCDVILALQNVSEMRLVKSLCDTLKYDYKVCADCPWLKGNYKNYDEDLEGLYMEMPPEDQ